MTEHELMAAADLIQNEHSALEFCNKILSSLRNSIQPSSGIRTNATAAIDATIQVVNIRLCNLESPD